MIPKPVSPAETGSAESPTSRRGGSPRQGNSVPTENTPIPVGTGEDGGRPGSATEGMDAGPDPTSR